jgi:hypothetical protein
MGKQRLTNHGSVPVNTESTVALSIRTMELKQFESAASVRLRLSATRRHCQQNPRKKHAEPEGECGD